MINSETKVGWCMTLCSLWQVQNDCVWNNKKVDENTITWSGSNLYRDWSIAHGLGSLDGAQSSSNHIAGDVLWRKPQHWCVKLNCNIDASFSLTENKVCISLCIRDALGNFIMGETMGLYLAISWVREVSFKEIIFEMDEKMMVVAFNSNKIVLYLNFSRLISVC